MKKLVLLLILSLACLFGVTACNKEDEKPNDNPTEQPTVDYVKQLADGVSFLKQYYAGKGFTNKEVTVMADIEKLISKSADCSVEWSVEVTTGNADDAKVVKNDDGSYTVQIVDKADSDVLFKLIATVKAGDGSTSKVEYSCKVPGFAVNTHAEYLAAAAKDPIIVEGVVTAIVSKDAYGDTSNELYLQDLNGAGGYYVYGLENDPVAAGIQVGMTVRASGVKDVYNGTHEVKNASLEIINSTVATVTPIDVTELYKANELNAKALVDLQGALVTIKGVTIGTVGDNGYRHFTLSGKESYLRISSSNCPLNAADTATFEAAFPGLLGHTANVTGIVAQYSGKFYIQPADLGAIQDLGLPQLSDAEKVAAEKATLAIDPKLVFDGASLTLPLAGAAHTDVVIAWESQSAEAVLGENGALTINTNGQNATLTLVATLTCGEATDTKEVELKVWIEPAVVETTIAALADNKPTEDAMVIYVVEGTWTAKDGMLPSANQYGNGTLTADGKSITVYGLSSKKDGCLTYAGVYTYKNLKDFPTLEITDGAVIKVGMVYTSAHDNYSCYLIEIVSAGGEVVVPDTVTTIEAALAAADGTPAVLTGTVKTASEWNTQYNDLNITLEDEAGNTIYVYALKTKVSVGDKITVTGTVGTHNGSKQIAKGATAEILGNAGGETPTPDPEPTVITTIEAALSAAQGAAVELTGTVSEIYQAYDSGYKNISVYIKDEAGKTILAFRMKGTGADTLAVGDTIKVTGTVTLYNEVNQIAAGCTFEMLSVHTCDYAEATCVAPETCKLCGKTQGEVSTEHNYVNGVCQDCKEEDPNYEGEVASTLAKFEFGANGSATHNDGDSNNTWTSKTFTEGDYSLNITGANKVYEKAFDAKGNSCLKLGTSSVVGTFTFTVAENVTQVVIYVAGYKTAATTKVDINGTEYTVSTASNNGEYTAITIDTSTTKTIKFTSVTKRCMINSIEFVGFPA